MGKDTPGKRNNMCKDGKRSNRKHVKIPVQCGRSNDGRPLSLACVLIQENLALSSTWLAVANEF